jgi:hypothetical protein
VFSVILAAYTSMVRPTMEYASSVWDPTNREKIINLEKVQKRAAKFVFNTYTDRTPGCVNKMVESLKWICCLFHCFGAVF